jgi:hypothetical protein
MRSRVTSICNPVVKCDVTNTCHHVSQILVILGHRYMGCNKYMRSCIYATSQVNAILCHEYMRSCFTSICNPLNKVFNRRLTCILSNISHMDDNFLLNIATFGVPYQQSYIYVCIIDNRLQCLYTCRVNNVIATFVIMSVSRNFPNIVAVDHCLFSWRG